MDARLEKIRCHTIQHNDSVNSLFATISINDSQNKHLEFICCVPKCFVLLCICCIFYCFVSVIILSDILLMAEVKVLKDLILGTVRYFLLIVQQAKTFTK
jgi:hypothetical protein